MARFLNASDIVITLSAPPVLPASVQLQGFATSDMYSSDAIEPAEVRMGVDGNLSAGFTYKAVTQLFMLQADSLSIDVIEQIMQFQQQAGTLVQLSSVTTIPGTQKVYTAPKGFLTAYSTYPDAKAVLDPRKFGVTWERVFAALTA